MKIIIVLGVEPTNELTARSTINQTKYDTILGKNKNDREINGVGRLVVRQSRT